MSFLPKKKMQNLRYVPFLINDFFGNEMATLLFHFLPLLSDSGQKDFVVGGLDKEDLWVKQKFQSINQRESPYFLVQMV